MSDVSKTSELIARLTASVNPLSVTCGECGSKPGKRCYGNGEMRRSHPSRESKAERELRIEAADALVAAAPIPHPVIDEAALAEVIAKSRGFGNGWEQIPPLTRGAYREIARAVAEWLKERDVAEKYGIAQMTVSNIKTGKTWGHITGR